MLHPTKKRSLRTVSPMLAYLDRYLNSAAIDRNLEARWQG
jgi:hypothetical protein